MALNKEKAMISHKNKGEVSQTRDLLKEQSLYSKANLYNLESDDDELDFLRKDVDFGERESVRKAYK